MRRTSLSLLMLALLVGACSDDGGQPIDPERLSLQIVSGDRQVAPVADAPDASQAALPAGLSLQQLPDNLLPEPLVARIVVDGEPIKALGSGISGLSLATLPEDVVVTYRVIQPTDLPAGDKRHCGDSFITSAKPDDAGLVTTYWERGTYAGECRMEVRLVVDKQPRVDTAFVVEFEPGAPVTVYPLKNQEPWFFVGDTIDARSLIDFGEDAHGNRIGPEIIGEMPDSLVTWTVSESRHGSTAPEFQGAGWGIVVPSMADYTPVDPGDGNPRYYRLRLHIVVDGAYTPEYAHVRIHVDEPE